MSAEIKRPECPESVTFNMDTGLTSFNIRVAKPIPLPPFVTKPRLPSKFPPQEKDRSPQSK